MKIDFDSDAFENDFFSAAVKCNQFMLDKWSDEPFYGLSVYADEYMRLRQNS